MPVQVCIKSNIYKYLLYHNTYPVDFARAMYDSDTCTYVHASKLRYTDLSFLIVLAYVITVSLEQHSSIYLFQKNRQWLYHRLASRRRIAWVSHIFTLQKCIRPSYV